MMRRSASSTRPLSLLKEEKGLPMPSSARPSPRGVARQIRRKWPLYLLLAVVSLLLIGKFSSSSKPTSSPYSSTFKYGLSDVGEERREAAAPVKLEQPPDELLMAEDDLALQVEDPVLSPEELARATANEAETAASREAAKTEQLQAMIWFLYHGGVLPSIIPTKMSAKEWRDELGEAWEIKKTSAGTKHAQADSYSTEGEMPELFPGGWEDESKLRTRVTVFSKSYCPYSRRAKGIIGKYDLDPPPFILELDHRPDDMDAIQDALYSLTGRRTVPNVIVDFEPIGGSDEVATLHGEGSLEKKLLRGQTKFVFNANGELESHEI
ncbi:hypothetical protein A1Q2_01083 [Trichosporon asahii var. asahii CBS 8904]|uniref:Glutaredoxin domain-containing protein n=1 Tax=Trichosporon asahii var. asahii (strain CBS 8904) TaxID=1220162 RepID=K1W6U7_TRIAC|nr:hypothetical protein A1Q2_01083 [Trichosporon asahii var. asahii CBS 8904]